MKQQRIGTGGTLIEVSRSLPESSVPELVGQLYDMAPPEVRASLLEQLLRPLGALSLVAVAGGIFAQLRFRGGWQELHVRLDDLPGIQSKQVIALVEHVQQVRMEAVNGLAQLLTNSPLMASSAAAAILVAVLIQRVQNRAAKVRETSWVDRF